MDSQPGLTWFNRFLQAFLDENLAAIWSLQTRASRELTLERLSDPEAVRTLAETMGVPVEGRPPREVWETMTRASCREMAAGRNVWEYAGEARDGDVLVVRMALPLGETEQVLVEEDGDWKLDKVATERRQAGA